MALLFLIPCNDNVQAVTNTAYWNIDGESLKNYIDDCLEIEKIVFDGTNTDAIPYSSGEDLSKNHDGSVMAYYEYTTETLYIKFNGILYLNSD